MIQFYWDVTSVNRKVVPSISEDHSIFNFRVNQCRKNAQFYLTCTGYPSETDSLWTWRVHNPSKHQKCLTQQQCHIPKDPNRHQHYRENLKSQNMVQLEVYSSWLMFPAHDWNEMYMPVLYRCSVPVLISKNIFQTIKTTTMWVFKPDLKKSQCKSQGGLKVKGKKEE